MYKRQGVYLYSIVGSFSTNSNVANGASRTRSSSGAAGPTSAKLPPG